MSRSRWFNGLAVPRKVSLEISAFCNRKCSWCPQHDHPRKQELMPMPTIEKVARDLAAAGFAGSFGLHFFNEPLCDKRLEDIVRLVKSILPDAEVYFHTNGDLLTVERFRDLLTAGLHKITVNQYEGKPSEAFLKFLADLTVEEKARVKWRVFKKHNIYNRAGLVQTKRQVPIQRQCRRTSQLCVNYKGDVVLCCNDFLGQVCAGNVMEKSVVELYNAPLFQKYRAALALGNRAELPLCDKCDLFG